jgi:HisJ family histidinol phosphate phosphatase
MTGRKFNPQRVFSRIQPGWDHDLHIHSNWSQDNLEGPSLAEYIPVAERYKLHIGFVEHFEMLYYDKEKRPMADKLGDWKLNFDSLNIYLEEVDQLREAYPFVSSGLEIDYYPYRENDLHEFVDRIGDQFDLLIGSVHELEDYRPVTLRKDYDWLVEKHGSVERVAEIYFDFMDRLVESRLFDAVAHPDVVFRFLPKYDGSTSPSESFRSRIIHLGDLCLETNTMMEINLSGLRYQWGRTFPPIDLIQHLRAQGVTFFIGSDSHTVQNLHDSILSIRQYNNRLRERL